MGCHIARHKTNENTSPISSDSTSPIDLMDLTWKQIRRMEAIQTSLEMLHRQRLHQQDREARQLDRTLRVRLRHIQTVREYRLRIHQARNRLFHRPRDLRELAME